MKGNETKQRILQIGLELFRQNGYHHTGIKEILDQADIPKGSFYHYFKSKEDLGLQAIDLYAMETQTCQRDIENSTERGLSRLKTFFSVVCEKIEEDCFSGGCLLGNLSQELADSNPIFKDRLDKHWKESCNTLRKWIQQAQEEGSIPKTLQADDTANFLLNSYQGAILRSKVSQNPEPLMHFQNIVFSKVLT